MHELLRRADYKDDLPQNTDAVLLDGMALLQTLKHILETFGDLAEKVVCTIIASARKVQVNMVDFVSDTYSPVSIKNIEQEKNRCRV